MMNTDSSTEHLYVHEESQAVPISHFVRALERYKRPIILSLFAVGIAYGIVAILLYVLSPTQVITTQRFRLDFEGASAGHYPNGSRFGIADVISGPNLQRVYRDDHLGELIGYGDFSHSVFVLESNVASEQLAAEFQARLSDPRLNAVDRERIQSDYELKRQSLTKNEYSINFVRGAGLPRNARHACHAARSRDP